MSKPTIQSIFITKVQKAAPNLRYVAFYDGAGDCVKACMHCYDKRSFVYILTSDFEETECCIYIGKTSAQYARFLSHIKMFDFDHIYLFECDSSNLLKSEELAIKEVKPLYNRRHNPLELRYKQILEIDYDKPKTAETIQKHLFLKSQYEEYGVFGFSLHPAIFNVLNNEAKMHNRNVSDVLQLILEKIYHNEIAEELKSDNNFVITNLTTTTNYAKRHGCSRESIKQFLSEDNRITAVKIGRDWVLPQDAYFPEDRRKKC